MSDEALEELRDHLHNAKLKSRLSMTALTRRSGLGRTTVSQAFSGRSAPSEATIIGLAAALNLDTGPLLELRRRSVRGDAGSQPKRVRNSVRSQNAGLRTEDVEFESRYRSYLIERHGQLTVVGLDLRGPAQAHWPLDAAYLSLELAEQEHTWGAPNHNSTQQRVERAEFALSGHQRSLVRGLAGSGKTTLLQWLAYATATGNAPAPLADLRSSIAFFLPLRTFSRRGELPQPDQFLSSVGCPISSAQPQGWADRVLASGRAVILVDGLDEVPAKLRERTSAWLRELLSGYSRSRVIVTTRPNAVPNSWLQQLGFRELTVRPMTRSDVGIFVTRWHSAAKASASNDELRAHLDNLETQLRDKVRAKRDLALLTTTPLLCALVCALHRDRRGQLPNDRVELYSAALSMLLYRRDQEREVVAPEGVILNEKESIQLLQKLAYWLIRNGQTELSSDTAEDLIEQALSGMPDVASQGTSNEVLRHLVSRTGLLRAPTEDTIDFVHRTFQDFLGAKAAVESYDLHYIANQAHDEQWQDVVRMTVAHARPDERAKFLASLLRRSDREPDFSTRLRLLALACLQHATELSTAVRSEVQEKADSLLPPRSAEESQELVQVGPVVLDLLPAPDQLTPEEIEPTIATAQGIGGYAALAYLKSFQGLNNPAALDSLTQNWAGFDAHEYVTEVLAPIRGPFEYVVIQDRQQAEAIAPLNVTGIFYVGDFETSDFTEQKSARNLRELSLGSNEFVYHLEWLEKYPKLVELRLYGCPELAHLDGIESSSLTHLTLEGLHPNLDITPLRNLTSLSSLELETDLSYRDLSELPIHNNLTALSLGSRSFGAESIEGLSRWTTLQRLSLPMEQFTHNFVEILGMSKLRSLTLTEASEPYACEEMPEVPAIEQVDHLYIHAVNSAFDMANVVRTFPFLHAIRLVAAGPGVEIDIAPLAKLQNCNYIILVDFAIIHGSDRFPPQVVAVHPSSRVR
ncbi:NACHT domain-containing protein [Streptomyces scabiei]|uniref:NACHT domain protein n=1 Tax=Streptomyces scabiei TaxID=1930 RepID=A0A100JVZ3_STRSC|nr:NACHT domain-containing protein [Streptomyces scabiei]GAQ66700.1 NACHT domain protein [Streptomyces scabiei]